MNLFKKKEKKKIEVMETIEPTPPVKEPDPIPTPPQQEKVLEELPKLETPQDISRIDLANGLNTAYTDIIKTVMDVYTVLERQGNDIKKQLLRVENELIQLNSNLKPKPKQEKKK